MGTIKIVLKSHQPKKDGTIPILIRVTIDRKTKHLSTGYAVKEYQFKPGTENWVIKHPDAFLINAAIEEKRAALAEKMYKADIEEKSIDVHTLSGKKAKGSTFFSAVRSRMEMHEARNQPGSYYRLQSKLNLLKDAWGRDVALSDLNKYWVDKYISHRIKAGVKIITIKKDLSDFSGVLTAIEYKGYDPFKPAQRALVAPKSKKEKLTKEEISAIETTKFYGITDVARDMFLFAYYTHGMRFENVATFKESMIKKGYIRYQMNKGQDTREIEISSKLAAIIKKYKGGKPYLFPVLKQEIKDVWEKRNIIASANTLVNTNLKKIAVICGIDKNVTTHISRHTFSYLTLKRGVKHSVIKDALGHGSIKTTENYLQSLSDDEINEAVKGLYD